MSDRRTDFIQALRDCATFLETHPGIQTPVYVVMNTFVDTREDITAHARLASWEKIFGNDWFYLRKAFGDDLSLDITTARSTVCRQVVTGTRTVEAEPERIIPAQPAHEVETTEWVCEPALLAEPAVQA